MCIVLGLCHRYLAIDRMVHVSGSRPETVPADDSTPAIVHRAERIWLRRLHAGHLCGGIEEQRIDSVFLWVGINGFYFPRFISQTIKMVCSVMTLLQSMEDI